MKILHTADWHLGKRLEKFSRFNEQVEVMQEICGIAETHQVDAVLIAGDLFDAFNPDSASTELFYTTLKRLSNHGHRLVLAIAGNHDSAERIDAPDALARANGIVLNGMPFSTIAPLKLETGLELLRAEPGFVEFKLPNTAAPLRVLLTPYTNEFRLQQALQTEDKETELRDVLQQKWAAIADAYCDDKGVNMLMAHLFVIKKGETPPPEPEDEKPILHIGGAQAIYTHNFPKQMQYVALGHLHGYNTVSENPCPVVYSSSPLAYSFAEANQQKYAVLIEAEPGQPVSLQPIPLQKGKRLLRYKTNSVESALLWLQNNQQHLVELTLEMDTYLTSQERKALHQAHEGLVNIIPIMRGGIFENSSYTGPDLTLNREKLFEVYFESRHGQKPNNELIALFKEIVQQ